MNRTEDVLEILRIMKITHDKFVRKNDIEVFQNSATFLWLLCQDKAIAKVIFFSLSLNYKIQIFEKKYNIIFKLFILLYKLNSFCIY